MPMSMGATQCKKNADWATCWVERWPARIAGTRAPGQEPRAASRPADPVPPPPPGSMVPTFRSPCNASCDALISVPRLSFLLSSSSSSSRLVPMMWAIRNPPTSPPSGNNVVTKPVDQVARMKTVLSPDGLVFHQSRVGSTLAANLLGSDPQNLVFSESVRQRRRHHFGTVPHAVLGCIAPHTRRGIGSTQCPC